MNELEKSHMLDMQNTIFLNYLSNYLKNYNMEAFWDILKQFQDYNTEYFIRVIM